MFCHGGPPQRLPLRPSLLHRLPFRSRSVPTAGPPAARPLSARDDRPRSRPRLHRHSGPARLPLRTEHSATAKRPDCRPLAGMSWNVMFCHGGPPQRALLRPSLLHRLPFRSRSAPTAGPPAARPLSARDDRPRSRPRLHRHSGPVRLPLGAERGGAAKRPGRRPSPAPSRGRHGGPPQRLPLRPSLLHRLPFRSNPLLVPARPRRVPFPRVTTGLEAGPGFTVIADRTGCPWGRSAAEPQSAPAAVPPPPPRGDVMEARRSAAPLRPSFLHRLPFRSSPLPPPARLAARPLFARIARACAPAPVRAFRAGAVRAPDCAHARSRQSAHVSPAFHRGFFRAGAAAGGEAVRADPLPSSRPHLTSDFPESSRPR